MNLRVEIRGAVLITLLMLLWLAVAFMIGLQDQFIKFNPFVTGAVFFAICVFAMREAYMSKRDELRHGFTFGKAFLCGGVIAFMAAVLAVPAQLAFHYFINPDYLDTMIAYAVQHGQNADEAVHYYNLSASLIQTAAGTLVMGLLIALAAAFLMQVKTEK